MRTHMLSNFNLSFVFLFVYKFELKMTQPKNGTNPKRGKQMLFIYTRRRTVHRAVRYPFIEHLERWVEGGK